MSIQELLQVLKEAAIETSFGKQMFLEFENTINSNLNLAKNPWKICVKKFIFSEVSGLQAYSWQL